VLERRVPDGVGTTFGITGLMMARSWREGMAGAGRAGECGHGSGGLFGRR